MVSSMLPSGSLHTEDHFCIHSPGKAPKQSGKIDCSPASKSPEEKSSECHSAQIFLYDVNDIQAKQAQDNLREQYLMKLSHAENLLIFDWDDTLMYTSFLFRSNGQMGTTAATQKTLEQIEKSAFALLQKATQLGLTVIVTNAEKGWVEKCIDLYMPSLKQLMEQVPVISARSTYERDVPDPRQWKNRAFLELGKYLDPLMITNLLAVGDSDFEIEAVQLLGQHFPDTFVKSVKLIERPSPDKLLRQLDLLTPKLKALVEGPKNMKLRLEGAKKK